MASYTKCSILGEIFVMKYDAFIICSPSYPCAACRQVGFHGIIIVGAPFHIIMPAAVKMKKGRKNKGRMGTNNWVMNWSGMEDEREAELSDRGGAA